MYLSPMDNVVVVLVAMVGVRMGIVIIIKLGGKTIRSRFARHIKRALAPTLATIMDCSLVERGSFAISVLTVGKRRRPSLHTRTRRLTALATPD